MIEYQGAAAAAAADLVAEAVEVVSCTGTHWHNSSQYYSLSHALGHQLQGLR